MVSQAWKSLSPEQRSVWEEISRQDKERFELEKKNYTGPWKVPAGKDPSAPKRPMSAFLDFSNSRRTMVRTIHPNATNGQISSMLAKVWKEAPDEVKREYVEREAKRREQYKRDMAAWTKANKNKGVMKTAPEPVDKDMDEDKGGQNDVDNDDRKPAAEVGQVSVEMAHRPQPEASVALAPGGSRQQYLQANHFAQLPDSSAEGNVTQPAMYAARNRSYSSEESALSPLTSTDFGGFLAAAAALDNATLSKASHLNLAKPDVCRNEGGDDQVDTKLPASTRVPKVGDMGSNVRKVVSQLPGESMEDADLPKLPN